MIIKMMFCMIFKHNVINEIHVVYDWGVDQVFTANNCDPGLMEYTLTQE